MASYLPAPLPLDQSSDQNTPATLQSDTPVQSTSPAPKSGSSFLPEALPQDTPNPAADEPAHGYWWNLARTFADQAVIPHAFDRLMASGPGGTGDMAREEAISKKAEDDLGLTSSIAAKTAGQYATIGNLSRYVPYVNTVTNNPIAQGFLSNGLGKVMEGDFNTADIAAETAKGARWLCGGELVGRYGGDLVKRFTGTSFDALGKQAQDAVDAAFQANSPNWGKTVANKIGLDHLTDLHGIYQRGGDVAAKAEELAQSAGGAAKDAYQNIAAAANKATDPGLYAGAAGMLASHHLGDWGAAVWPVVQRVAKYANEGVKDIDVRSAIDRAMPDVSGLTKSNINPANLVEVGCAGGLPRQRRRHGFRTRGSTPIGTAAGDQSRLLRN